MSIIGFFIATVVCAACAFTAGVSVGKRAGHRIGYKDGLETGYACGMYEPEIDGMEN